jgi:hypothetical protein
MGRRPTGAKSEPSDARTEMALHVLAYNLTRVMNIIGVQALLATMRAYACDRCYFCLSLWRRPPTGHAMPCNLRKDDSRGAWCPIRKNRGSMN